jgi:acyl dehydratase
MAPITAEPGEELLGSTCISGSSISRRPHQGGDLPARGVRAARVRKVCALRTINFYGKRTLNDRAPDEQNAQRQETAMTKQTAVRHKRGGLYFEDFTPGEVVEHRLTRTVTQMDNMLFSNMTLNPQPLHIDRHFCEQETEWGQPLMNSLFTLGLMIGISVNDLTVGTTIANLGMTDVKFPHPLFEGDTVHATTEIIGKRESKSRPGAGIVELHHRAYNQDNKLIAECRRQAFMRMRPM